MDKIAIISLFLIFFSVIVIILGIVEIHTYPGKVAAARNHPQKEAIEVTSLMGLIIFPLWMLALVWSYSGAVIGNLYQQSGKDDADKAAADRNETADDLTEPGSAPESRSGGA